MKVIKNDAPQKVIFVAGTRPNFMKIAPLLWEANNETWIEPIIVHTGQHYDDSMSDVFFRELQIPKPDLLLKAGDVTDYEKQKSYIAEEIYKTYKNENIAVIVVVGDVNSTAGGAMAGELLKVPVAHVEAGLRSFDLRMPEEHNRIYVDKRAKYLFVTEPSGIKNLKDEKIIPSDAKAYHVGNVMIDTLLRSLPSIQKIRKAKAVGLSKGKYVVVTLHRKENLEDMAIFKTLLNMILTIAAQVKVTWILHPRTKKYLLENGMLEDLQANDNLVLLEPLSYFELISLLSDALCAVTDSGGIQDETTVLGIPCLTIRRSTERPITTTVGSSTLVGENGKKLLMQFSRIRQGTYKKSSIPRFWDGRAAKRIMKILEQELAT